MLIVKELHGRIGGKCVLKEIDEDEKSESEQKYYYERENRV